MPRMKRLAILAALVLAAAGAYAVASRGRGGGGPDLAVVPDPLDFGVHRWGEQVRLSFRIVNRSDHAVTIRDPTIDCPCFVLLTRLSKLKFSPGEEAAVSFDMDTTKKPPGPFHKTLTIQMTEPTPGQVDVAVIGTVIDYRKIEPRQVVFDAVAADGPPAERKVEVRGGDGSDVRVTKAVAGDAARITVEVKPATNGADLLVRTVRGAPKGRIQSQVLVDLEVRQTAGGEAHAYSETIWVTGDVK